MARAGAADGLTGFYLMANGQIESGEVSLLFRYRGKRSPNDCTSLIRPFVVLSRLFLLPCSSKEKTTCVVVTLLRMGQIGESFR